MVQDRRAIVGSSIMMRAFFSAMVLGAASASELVVNVGLQTGSFLIGADISMLNAHDYRPNEFVTSDVRLSTCSKPQTQPGHDV